MEINYCSKCHSRVSSVDIDAGKGLKTAEGKIYCGDCVKDADISVAPAAQAAKKTTAIRKPGSSPNRKTVSRSSGSSHRRPAVSSRDVSATGKFRLKERQGAEAVAKSNSNAIIIGVGVIVILVLLIAIVLVMQKKQPVLQAPVPDAPVQNDPAVPDGPRVVQPIPDTIPKVPAGVPMGMELPAYTSVVSGTGFKELAGGNWKTELAAERGTWEEKNNILTCLTGGNNGVAILKSRRMYDHFEAGITLAASSPVTVEIKFRDHNYRYGKWLYQVKDTSRWHTLQWRVEGSKAVKADAGGYNALSGNDPSRKFFADDMAEDGPFIITVNSLRGGTARFGIGEFKVKEVAATETAAASSDKDPGAGTNSAVPEGSIKLDPFDSDQPWDLGNVRPENRDGIIYMEGDYYNLLYKVSMKQMTLTGTLELPQQSNGNVAITFPARKNNHEDGCARTVFFSDGTVQLKGLASGQASHDRAFQPGTAFQFSIAVENGKIRIKINGNTQIEKPYTPPFTSGILIRLNASSPGEYAKLSNLVLQAPGLGSSSIALKKNEYNFLAGGDLLSAGWERMSGDNYSHVFQLSNGALKKPTSEKNDLIQKHFDVISNDWGISGKFEFTQGNYWDIGLYTYDRGALSIGIDGSRRGTHTFEIIGNGKEVTVSFDGHKALPARENKLTRAPGPKSRLRLYTQGDVVLSISELKFWGIKPHVIPPEPDASTIPVPSPSVPADTVQGKEIILQQGVNNYIGCIDTTLNQEHPSDTGRGDRQWLEVERYKVSQFREETLIRFDLTPAQIPAQSKVLSAVLTLYAERQNNRGNTTAMELYRVNEMWDERSHYDGTRDLNVTYIGQVAKQQFMGNRQEHKPPKPLEIDITSLVQGWVSNPNSNYGIRLDPGKGDYNYDMRFSSSETGNKAQRPQLKIVLGEGSVSSTSTVAETERPEPAVEAGAITESTAEVPAATGPSSVFECDFDSGLPKGSTGKASRWTKKGTQAIESVKARSGGFEVEVIIPLPEPITVTAANRLQLMYYGQDAKKANFGFRGKDADGNPIEAGYVQFGFAVQKWNAIDLAITDLKIQGKPAAPGMIIEELVFQAGFKGAETKAKLYIDNITIIN